ncbi:MAG: metalloregulator ArsR/SmtB family transcription factor [Candidatus Shapirobacteria bacterium]|nr:metalloregulator ArsR/SmtB family transcription factor [Candidatus Shapirobacteria bacterium]MDD4382531.1 metalloregulator ArsR/SmtB family transcription factor [Candidatus Shapirobacteria bacterium]
MDKIFKAMADVNRRKILTLLRNGEMSVNELLKNFEITQATLSNHLSILRKAKLVESRILGKRRIYRLNIEPLKFFTRNIGKFVGNLGENIFSEIEIRTRK